MSVLKDKRLSFIVKVIDNKKVRTQEDLLKILAENGYILTQATLSRDLKVLKASKFIDEAGNQFYYVPKTKKNTSSDDYEIASVKFSSNICVLKVKSGYANVTALKIDESGIDAFYGTIAGDDTIFIVFEEDMGRDQVGVYLKKIFKNIIV